MSTGSAVPPHIPNPPPANPPLRKHTSVLATLALICPFAGTAINIGGRAVAFQLWTLIFFADLVVTALGIVLGGVALWMISRDSENLEGKGLAIAGTILACLKLGLFVYSNLT